MNLRSTRSRKKANTSNSYDANGFYSSNHNDNTYNNYNEPASDAQYYDYSQQDHTAQHNTNFTDDSWNDNQDDYYSKPTEPQKKKNKFVRPRPKRNIPQKSTSFHPQHFQPNTTSSNTPQNQTTNISAPTNTFNNDFIAAGLSAVTGSQMTSNIGSSFIQNQLQSKFQDTIQKAGILSLSYYKYYFRVHNDYVLKKLSRLLFPFLKMNVKEWKRQRINEISNDNTAPPPKIDDSYLYQPPIYDINAPDGYLPLMAIVTYIVIMGFVVGTQSSSDGNDSITFSPQILIATGSSAFVMLCIEVVLMKFAFYLIGSVALAPYWLDIVCYTGYKLVFVTINLVINLIFDSLVLYYVISITTGIFAAIFMIQTLRPYFRDLSEFASGPLMDVNNEPKKTRKIFLGVVGVAQILFIQLMGRYTSL